MILYTKNADSKLLLLLLAELAASGTISSNYTEYIHYDDLLAVLELEKYSKEILLKQLENYAGIEVLEEVSRIHIPALDIVIRVEDNKRFKKLLGGGNKYNLGYNDSGLILPSGEILLREDVCFTNIMGKVPESYDINKVVAAFYTMSTI